MSIDKMMPTSFDIVGKDIKGDEALPYMVEIDLVGDDKSTMFLRVKETLERIGIVCRLQKDTLLQSCHIFHKRGRYYIVHFKTMFILDGRVNGLTGIDISRQNKIIHLLQDWNMIKILDESTCVAGAATDVRVLKHHERESWTLKPKYRLCVPSQRVANEERRLIPRPANPLPFTLESRI